MFLQEVFNCRIIKLNITIICKHLVGWQVTVWPKVVNWTIFLLLFFLQKASDRSWRQFYAVLIGTTLYLYKERRDFLASDEVRPVFLPLILLSSSNAWMCKYMFFLRSFLSIPLLSVWKIVKGLRVSQSQPTSCHF